MTTGVRFQGVVPSGRDRLRIPDLRRYGISLTGNVTAFVTTIPIEAGLEPDDFTREGPTETRMARIANGSIFRANSYFVVAP